MAEITKWKMAVSSGAAIFIKKDVKHE